MNSLFMDPEINEWLRAMHARVNTPGSIHILSYNIIPWCDLPNGMIMIPQIGASGLFDGIPPSPRASSLLTPSPPTPALINGSVNGESKDRMNGSTIDDEVAGSVDDITTTLSSNASNDSNSNGNGNGNGSDHRSDEKDIASICEASDKANTEQRHNDAVQLLERALPSSPNDPEVIFIYIDFLLRITSFSQLICCYD
jgi:hypothetical protein